ncbi:MAG: hypothetical protein Q7S51_11075 [Gallionellaceae bacterium]|nr:hypothetical protein [Gallionellaceae bacterium]
MSTELKHTALASMADYTTALDTLCGLAQHTLVIFDKNFSDIGLNSAACEQTLRHFLLDHSSNRLHLLTHDARSAMQYCPRLMALLRQFSHCMHIYQTPKHLGHLSEPFAVADEIHYARRFHFNDSHGLFAQYDPEQARAFKSQFDEMWAASHPGVTAHTSGL